MIALTDLNLDAHDQLLLRWDGSAGTWYAVYARDAGQRVQLGEHRGIVGESASETVRNAVFKAQLTETT